MSPVMCECALFNFFFLFQFATKRLLHSESNPLSIKWICIIFYVASFHSISHLTIFSRFFFSKYFWRLNCRHRPYILFCSFTGDIDIPSSFVYMLSSPCEVSSAVRRTWITKTKHELVECMAFKNEYHTRDKRQAFNGTQKFFYINNRIMHYKLWNE